MIHYSQCPVCKSSSIKPFLSAKDNTVSKAIFAVWQCDQCSVRFTQDIPGQEAIGSYYASDNYVSHSDTQEGFINKLYHLIRKRTLAGKLKLVSTETGKQSGKILDVGCGTGAFLHTMQQAGWSCTGLEPDEAARSKASSLYNIEAQPSAQIYTLQSQTYEAITLWHVLEHVHELHEYVEQLKKLLAENGRLFIAVPNYTSHDAAVYKENWAAYDVPRHLYHFSPASIKILMNAHGLEVKKMRPMWFDSFYVSMLSEQYKNGKGNIISAFMIGLISNIKTVFNHQKCSSVIYIIAKAS
jgi:2-polyprenyl-3-methyl-5-hydroxy-6-metoxy-1,4-benzoquinol methylase